MTQKRNSKRAFAASIMSLILCVTMLLGTTLAWFTDTVTNTGNRIQSGTLDIDLLMDKAKDGNYVSIADGTGDIFSEDGNGILWEPGKTEIVFLQIQNKGKLAVKYDMLLTVKNGENDDPKLTDVLDYAIIDGMTSEMYNNLYVNTGNASWENILKANGVQTGDVPEGEVTAAPNGQLLANSSDYVMLAVHMDENATNNYQDKEVTIDVQIDATQLPSEEDSFGSDYDAGASADEEVPQVKVIDLVQNGDFQKLNDGTPTNWSGFNTTTAMLTKDGENNYLTLKNTTNIFVSQTLLVEEADRDYTLSFDLKKVKGIALVKVEFYNAAGKPIGSKDFYPEITSSDWENVSTTINVPAETVKIAMLVRLIGAGELYYDNLKFETEMEVTSSTVAALAAEFRAMIAEEEANSMKVTKEVINEFIELEPLAGQPATLIANGNFEDGLNSWVPFNEKATNFVTLAEGEGREDSDAIKFSADAADGNPANPIYEQIIDAVGGAEYQVSYWYKIEEGSGNQPLVKFEAWGDVVNEVVTGYAQKDMKPASYERDGEWHYVVRRFRIPNASNKLHVMARMLTPKTEDQTVLIDDITVCMTAAPLIADLNTDQIFYYDDSKTATFRTEANIEFFPELADAKSDFEVYDGQTLVWEQKGVTANAGTATVTMSLAGLRKEVPYCVKATVYNADGTVADVQTQNIYIYARPEYLGADGIYMANGEEPFVPVIAYHTLPSQYQKLADAGINLVQMEPFGSAEQALEYLDAAEAAGIMGFIPLYNNMLPPGHEDNIDRTIAVLSDERVLNHPALFGYGTMDEVFLHFEDPYKMMEDSYRLIRMLDSKRPIMSVEAVGLYYNEAGKMVDVLVIDPYNTAAKQSAHNSSASAKKAVYGEKPVYTLLEAYRTAAGRLLTPEDGRNNNYQALIGGADAVGYYSIRDAERDENGKYTIPLWDANDGGALWNALAEWGTKEKDIAFAHFIFDESPVFNKDIDWEDPFWYYSWAADDGVYMVVLGMEEEQELAVSIPLTSADGSVKIGAYTAEVIAGDEEAVSGNDTLELTVDGVEAILYKITPSTTVDFSSLK